MANKIVVVGAGAAGLSCAISAADGGADVTLIEKTFTLGGTVAHSLIHTIGGLYNDQGLYINDGLPVRLATMLQEADAATRKRQMGEVWVLNVDPSIYEGVIKEWVGQHPNIRILHRASLVQVYFQKENPKRITQIDIAIEQDTETEVKQLPVDVLVDATGGAEVVRLITPDQWIRGDALAGLIFQIGRVMPNALRFPKNVGLQRNLKKAVDAGVLPDIFAQTWFDIGIYEDEIYAKTSILTSAYDGTVVPELAEQLTQFLQTLPNFANAQITRVGRLGIRDNGRIKGDYCLTLADVKAGRQFVDAVARCAWPIEYWDPNKGVTLDYLPRHHFYEIPLRSLKVSGMENLWAAGRCLSAEKLAQASARVAGTCWAMGDRLGQVLASPNS